MKRHQLDITRDHCPMTFVKTKLHLEQMEEDDILEVLLKEGEPLQKLPKTVSDQGYRVLETTHVKDDVYKVVIAHRPE